MTVTQRLAPTLLKDSALTFLGELACAAATFVGGILIARATGAAGKGTFTLAVGVASIGAAVFGLRWGRPTGYFLARDRGQLAAIAGSNVVMVLVATTIGFGVWQAWPGVFERVVLPGVDAAIVTLALCLVAGEFLENAIGAIYGGLRQFGARTVFFTVSSGMYALCSAALYVAGCRDVGRYLAVYCAVWSALLGGWGLAMLVRHRVVPRLDGRLMAGMAGYGGAAYLAFMFDLVTLRLDVFVLNYFAAVDQVGVYSIAVGLAAQLARIPNILSHVVFNRTSANELGSGATTARILRLATVSMLAGGVLVIGLGTVAIAPLYGREFAGAVPLLWVMVPASVCWGLFRLLASDIEGRGRPAAVTACSILAGLCIVVLDLWWIPAHGAMGAAWASLVAYAVALGAGAVCFCRITNMRWSVAYTPRLADLLSLRDALRRLPFAAHSA